MEASLGERVGEVDILVISSCGRMAVYSQQPTMARAPWLRGVNPCWCRPTQPVGKLSLAPCAALPPYSWPCWPVDGKQGKPWRHHLASVLVKLIFL